MGPHINGELGFLFTPKQVELFRDPTYDFGTTVLFFGGFIQTFDPPNVHASSRKCSFSIQSRGNLRVPSLCHTPPRNKVLLRP